MNKDKIIDSALGLLRITLSDISSRHADEIVINVIKLLESTQPISLNAFGQVSSSTTTAYGATATGSTSTTIPSNDSKGTPN